MSKKVTIEIQNEHKTFIVETDIDKLLHDLNEGMQWIAFEDNNNITLIVKTEHIHSIKIVDDSQ